MIFHAMCQKSGYTLPALTRVKLLLGFQYLVALRDEHFGNGRLARNIFERMIRQHANRIAGLAPLTRDILTTLQPEDALMTGVPPEVWDDLDDGNRFFFVTCPGCKQTGRVPQKHLGQDAQCSRCHRTFRADWGELVAQGAAL
jgi:hypothetical protein